jgi:hypothetical protein
LDDLLIGVVSSRKFAMHLHKELENFLKSNLHLKVIASEIVHRDQAPISFLGHMIQPVYFYQKVRTKNKLLETIYRYKNKVLQRLKLEEYRISKLQVNKFKKKVLKHLNIMLRELGLKGDRKSDVLTCALGYKLLGNALVQNINFYNLREFVQFLLLWNFSGFLQNSMFKKSYNVMDYDMCRNQSKVVINEDSQIYFVKFFKDFHIKKVWSMLKKIRILIRNKARLLTELTVFECVEIKSKQIVKVYTQQLLKNKLSKMISPMLEKEEVCKSLASSLIDSNLKKQPVRYFSIKANITKLCRKLRKIGLMHPIKNQASCCLKLVFFSEDAIIKYYNSIMRGVLSWFAGADNFQKVKKIVESIIRCSCWLTLKKKFRLTNIAEVINVYTKDVVVGTKKKFTSRLITQQDIIKKPITFIKNKSLTIHCIKEYLNRMMILF